MPDAGDVAPYLRDLVARARTVLGPNLVGAYAAGSLALDAYQPGRSDIDAALVTLSPLLAHEKQDLVGALRHESLPVPARGLELVVYTSAAAGSGSAEPRFEVELNTGPAMAFRATYDPADRPARDGRFWYALDRSLLSANDGALLGPPAREVFADVGDEDLRDLLVAALTWWLRQPGGATDAVLGACRSLVRFREGVWRSKVAAAEHLLARGYQPSAVITEALAARSGRGPAPVPHTAAAVQRAVRAEIRASHPQPSRLR